MVKATVELKINQAMITALFKDADKVIVDSANSLAKEMKKRIKTGAKSGKTYGNHTSSAPGQSPANWTGQLLRSIKVQKAKGIAFVYITAKYAEFLEFGTSKMRPRPFIIPAFIKTKKMIQDKLKRIAK